MIDGKTVEQILNEKHPAPAPANHKYVSQENNSLPYHPSIFDQINANKVRKTAMRISGSHGPSGLDSQEWRRILTIFGQPSTDLCKTIAKITKRIATENLPDEQLEAFNACRLIPLDKNPGVRPIGVGEVFRRIVGKILIRCVSYDLIQLGLDKQLCLGQKGGIEYAIHSLRSAYEDKNNEAMLLIDADNAFNSLNRELALKNVEVLCPSLATALKNSYSRPPALFVNGKKLLSREGTTQGDPLAMAMYGIAILPLIKLIDNENLCQKWFADDGNAVSKLDQLRIVLENVIKHGKHFGYHAKPSKCKLIVKNGLEEKAKKVFKGLNVEIVGGSRVLGSVIGSEEDCKQYLEKKTKEFEDLCNKLTNLAKHSPQNVYSCFTKGVQDKLSFLYRTTPDMENMRGKIKDLITNCLAPSITGCENLTNAHLDIFSLPLREGGLNLKYPEEHENDHECSKWISEAYEKEDFDEAITEHQNRTKTIQARKRETEKAKKSTILQNLSADQAYMVKLASEKGASNWLNVLPLTKYGFDLNKMEFKDGIHLRYGMDLKHTPVNSPVDIYSPQNMHCIVLAVATHIFVTMI